MEEAESKEKLLVLVVTLAARERRLVHHLVEPLHIGFETLCVGDEVQYVYIHTLCTHIK